MSEEEYKQMRSIVDLGCVNITKDNIVHMNRKTYEHKEQKRDLYKEVVEEVREYVEKTPIRSILEVHCGDEEEYTKPLLRILDKVKE